MANENEQEPAAPTDSVSETAAPAKPEAPKLTCDVTIVVRDGEFKALKVRAMGDITYGQLKEVCTAAASRVDAEFTAKCTRLGAHLYEPLE